MLLKAVAPATLWQVVLSVSLPELCALYDVLTCKAAVTKGLLCMGGDKCLVCAAAYQRRPSHRTGVNGLRLRSAAQQQEAQKGEAEV